MKFQYGKRCQLTPAPDLVARITRVGGLNRFGEPNYRIVWSRSRLGWIGGKFEAEEFVGNRGLVGVIRGPIYAYLGDAWVVEKWIAPEEYGSPRLWAFRHSETIDGQKVETLGPYPSRGDYEIVKSFPATIRLTSEVCDAVVGLVKRSAARSMGERAAHINAGIRAEEAAREQNLREIINDQVPAFDGLPFVSVPSEH